VTERDNSSTGRVRENQNVRPHAGTKGSWRGETTVKYLWKKAEPSCAGMRLRDAGHQRGKKTPGRIVLTAFHPDAGRGNKVYSIKRRGYWDEKTLGRISTTENAKGDECGGRPKPVPKGLLRSALSVIGGTFIKNFNYQTKAGKDKKPKGKKKKARVSKTVKKSLPPFRREGQDSRKTAGTGATGKVIRGQGTCLEEEFEKQGKCQRWMEWG